MITLYGIAGSRAQRSIWALEELGLDYEHVPVDFVKGVREASYRALNPNGRVPTLVDDDLVLFEGLAINLYLARKYDGGLWPASEHDQARALQWSMWALSELEPSFMDIFINTLILPEDKRDAPRVKYAAGVLKRPLRVLEAIFAEQDTLLGDEFTIADLNVAGVLWVGRFAGYDFANCPKVLAYYERCASRPAFVRAGKVGQTETGSK